MARACTAARRASRRSHPSRRLPDVPWRPRGDAAPSGVVMRTARLRSGSWRKAPVCPCPGCPCCPQVVSRTIWHGGGCATPVEAWTERGQATLTTARRVLPATTSTTRSPRAVVQASPAFIGDARRLYALRVRACRCRAAALQWEAAQQSRPSRPSRTDPPLGEGAPGRPTGRRRPGPGVLDGARLTVTPAWPARCFRRLPHRRRPGRPGTDAGRGPGLPR